MTAVFRWLPTTSSVRESEFRVNAVRFGNYTQRQRGGMRPVEREWRLTFEYPKSVIAEIEEYLHQRSGWDSFLFLDPSRGSLVRVVSSAPEVRPLRDSNLWESLTVTFSEDTGSGAAL